MYTLERQTRLPLHLSLATPVHTCDDPTIPVQHGGCREGTTALPHSCVFMFGVHGLFTNIINVIGELVGPRCRDVSRSSRNIYTVSIFLVDFDFFAPSLISSWA